MVMNYVSLNQCHDGCVTFINGDNRAVGVVNASGQVQTIAEKREDAADEFNRGDTRFLISTEAGGEGIDLQESCYSLVHVDLPWNPMRLHQRVGRLNRYGQKHRVEVRTVRNPDTVESRIWDKLFIKMQHIMTAMGRVMDEPEDLLQLVLGMESSSFFRELFSEGATVDADLLSDWFDKKTGRFGGRDAIEAVQNLVGNCARFDFGTAAPQIPRVDLPDLRLFFITMLRINRRMIREESDGLAFLTPEAWLTEPAVRTSYTRMIFDRQNRAKDAAQRILGVGHKLVNHAIKQAKESGASVASISKRSLKYPIVIFQIADRVTSDERNIRSVVSAIEIGACKDGADVFLKDWELLNRLNNLIDQGGLSGKSSSLPPDVNAIEPSVENARLQVEQRLTSLDLPFKIPQVELLSILWPTDKQTKEMEEEEFP
jgi:hypothetical protein